MSLSATYFHRIQATPAASPKSGVALPATIRRLPRVLRVGVSGPRWLCARDRLERSAVDPYPFGTEANREVASDCWERAFPMDGTSGSRGETND